VASGKSTLGCAWAQRLAIAYHNSDVIRKELAGERAHEGQGAAFGSAIYTPEFTRMTYEALLQRAAAALGAGDSLVLDASYQSESERRALRELAKELGATVVFIHCYCSEEETKRRLEIRAQDPEAVSDGRWEIYLQQRKRQGPLDDLGPHELLNIDTAKPLPELLDELERELLEAC